MLKADRIELAILNLILDWPDAAGRPFSLSLLTAAISITIGPVSDDETIDSLIVLHGGNLIGLGWYSGSTFLPYNPSEGKTFFYKPNFRCKALPVARRRQQQLSHDNRHGIFITHIR